MTIKADLVVRNASIFTAAAAGASTTASGFAAKDGKFLVVSSDDSTLDEYIDQDTLVKDLKGAAVVPGLVDAHIHHIWGGKMLLKQLQFPSTLPLDDVFHAIDNYASKLSKSEAWVTGGSWGSSLLSEMNTLEALKHLNKVSHGHPVFLSDDSHHNAWANTKALQSAGIWSAEATGVLVENETYPLRDAHSKAEKDTIDDLKEYCLAAWKLLHSYGITTVQDALVSAEQLEAMVALDKEGNLPGWVSNCLNLTGLMADSNFSEIELDETARKSSRERIRTDFTKIMLDGVPPTQTAAFHEPYLPSKEHGCNHKGALTMTTDELVGLLKRYQAQGRSTKIHCTGDWSVTVALDAFEIMRREGSMQTYQIAHGQFVTPADRRRMKELNVVADISPFLWYPGVIPSAINTVLPEERASQMQPNRDLLDLGVLVAGGSDWPVSDTPNTWEGIGGLVTRKDPTGQFPGELWLEQAVSAEEALRVFTINGAKSAHLDDVVGSIEAGKAANFVILDRDPIKINPEDIGKIKAVATYVAGEQVYSSAG